MTNIKKLRSSIIVELYLMASAHNAATGGTNFAITENFKCI